MKNKLNSVQSYPLFLSYFLVFLIPAALISAAVFKISDTILRDELQQNHILQVSTASYNLRNTLESFSVAATTAAYSEFGHPVDLTREIGAAMQLIGFLNRTGLSYGFVQDIFMIYRDDPYVYSGQTSFTRDNFLKYIRFSGIASEQAVALMDTADTVCCFSVSGLPGSIYDLEKEKDYILICIPCTRKEYTAGAMAFLIDTEKLNLFLGNNSREGYLCLTDNQQNALNESPVYGDRLRDFPGLTEAQKSGRDMSLQFYRSGAFTYTYGCILPGALYLVGISDSNSALGRLNSFRNLVWLILAGVFVLGTLFVLFAYMRNKKNLARLTSSYEEKLREVIPMKRREILYALIEGRYIYENDFIIQCEESMVDFQAAFHCCVLLPADGKTPDLELLLSEAAGFHVTLSYRYYVHKTGDINVWMAGTAEELPAGPRQLADRELFISRPVTRILDIHTAYSEVLSLKYLQHTAAPSDGVDAENDRLHQPHYDRLVNRINDCLSTSDPEGLKTWGGQMLEDMKQDGLSLWMRQKLLLQLFLTFPDTFHAPFDIHDILKMDKPEQIEDSLRSLLAFGVTALAPGKTAQEACLDVEKICAYIRENYTDPAFSLQLLADHFHVSNSYLSWFFKQKNGVTVLDYTTRLKMDLATGLLSQGYSLQQVALRVGYLNVSSFIRRFKQTMGMTPGEYKKGSAGASSSPEEH